MCIYKDEMLDRRSRVLTRKRFVHNFYSMVVRVSLYVVVYKYARPGSHYDWVVVFKVSWGASYDIQSGIEAISAAAQQDPIFLSRR